MASPSISLKRSRSSDRGALLAKALQAAEDYIVVILRCEAAQIATNHVGFDQRKNASLFVVGYVPYSHIKNEGVESGKVPDFQEACNIVSEVGLTRLNQCAVSRNITEDMADFCGDALEFAFAGVILVLGS